MQIKGRYIICYYAVLMLVMMSWTDYNSFPSMILRIEKKYIQAISLL